MLEQKFFHLVQRDAPVYLTLTGYVSMGMGVVSREEKSPGVKIEDASVRFGSSPTPHPKRYQPWHCQQNRRHLHHNPRDLWLFDASKRHEKLCFVC